MTDESWRLSAECHTIPVENRLAWFFPAVYDEARGYVAQYYDRNGHPTNELANARLVCARCPVSEQCLEWALENQPDGIWAGLTEDERRLPAARHRQRKWDLLRGGVCPVCNRWVARLNRHLSNMHGKVA